MFQTTLIYYGPIIYWPLNKLDCCLLILIEHKVLFVVFFFKKVIIDGKLFFIFCVFGGIKFGFSLFLLNKRGVNPFRRLLFKMQTIKCRENSKRSPISQNYV